MKYGSVVVGILFASSLGMAQSMVADVTLNPMGSFKAKTSDVKGEAILNGDTVTAQNIVMNLKNLKTGIELRDTHAKEKYLDVKKHPEAVLVKGEGKGGKGTAVIKWHDKEQTVSGTYEIQGDKLIAKFPIKLSGFGVEGISYKGIGVEDDVNVEVSVPVKKGAAAAPKAVPKAAAPAKKK